MPKILILYREPDSRIISAHIYDALVKSFGTDNVECTVGQVKRIYNPDTVVVVIGKTWLTVTNEQNQPLLIDPYDTLRNTLYISLTTDNVQVLPILVDGAARLSSDQLPDSIRRLAIIKAVRMRGQTYFTEDMKRIVSLVKQRTIDISNATDRQMITPALTKQPPQSTNRITSLLFILILLFISFIVIALLDDNPPPPPPITLTKVIELITPSVTSTVVITYTPTTTLTPTEILSPRPSSATPSATLATHTATPTRPDTVTSSPTSNLETKAATIEMGAAAEAIGTATIKAILTEIKLTDYLSTISPTPTYTYLPPIPLSQPLRTVQPTLTPPSGVTVITTEQSPNTPIDTPKPTEPKPDTQVPPPAPVSIKAACENEEPYYTKYFLVNAPANQSFAWQVVQDGMPVTDSWGNGTLDSNGTEEQTLAWLQNSDAVRWGICVDHGLGCKTACE